MHLSRRLIFSLLCGVALISGIFALYQANTEVKSLKNQVRQEAALVAESRRTAVEQALESGSIEDLQALADHSQGMAVFDQRGIPLAMASGLNAAAAQPAVAKALASGRAVGGFVKINGETAYVYALPLTGGPLPVEGAIAMIRETAWITAPIWRHAVQSAAQTLLIVGITLLIVGWSLSKPLRGIAQWLRESRTGNAHAAAELPKDGIFLSLTSEVARIATSLNEARAAAEEEARLREAALSYWTPERLRVSVHAKLNGSRLFAVSNREPYVHAYQKGGVVCSVPPSGLVTALEPVLRACDGTWIAQASGDADRDTSDEFGRLRVPPDHPQYTLRRVWLSKQEEDGFYFGFANEGLWPLCHIAHTRPVFRAADWEQYCVVNRKFAAAVLNEMRDETAPVVLVQDYHFALLPRMIKEQRPDARVAIFWHIPWPNPEAFGICPWQRELLDGMLGADLIGFHIQAHCNNFQETVDRALEARVDREHFAVKRREHVSLVRPFPISVAFTETPNVQPSVHERASLLSQLGVEATLLGLGVDRVDYTKGIPERLRGIERLLEEYPFYQGKLTFVQIGAPSRTRISRYRDLTTEVEEETERINRRFRTHLWKPIIFLNRHHSQEEILPFYRQADFCMVTSLHDGMNLVAKEYIAARSDEGGALILSRFTGASHELTDAFIVNPYDTDELARVTHAALAMPPEERQARMHRMRALVRENNVYRWAGNLIAELADIRLAHEGRVETEVSPLALSMAK
jgi:alpha,alpha-trehalose-phosphate synthase [UDP-forming]